MTTETKKQISQRMSKKAGTAKADNVLLIDSSPKAGTAGMRKRMAAAQGITKLGKRCIVGIELAKNASLPSKTCVIALFDTTAPLENKRKLVDICLRLASRGFAIYGMPIGDTKLPKLSAAGHWKHQDKGGVWHDLHLWR